MRLRSLSPERLFRPIAFAVAALMAATCCPKLHAAPPLDAIIPDAQFVAQLEQRAQLAKPREQCFLYTELVHAMTELAGKELRDGEYDQASATLKHVEHYASMIHMGLADDTKRLKDAELLMHHTVFRLSGLVRSASEEDRETLRSTLKQLDQVQGELMTQVFKH